MKYSFFYTTLTLLALLSPSVFAWQMPKNSLSKLPKNVQPYTKELRWIQGGSFIMGRHYGEAKVSHQDSNLLALSIPRQVTVSSFYISEKEVTNQQWRDFYQAKAKELGIEKAAIYLPDTQVWNKDFVHSSNQPMVENYYQHPAYAEYPVVGVSWEQAQAYCEWRTQVVNELLKKQNLPALPAFRLPTEAEWEYASSHEDTFKTKNGLKITPTWAFPPQMVIGKNGAYNYNFGRIVDNNNIAIKEYPDDHALFTAVTRSYQANKFGLYNTLGNVAEWVVNEACLDWTNQEQKMPMPLALHKDYAFLSSNPSDDALLDYLARTANFQTFSPDGKSQSIHKEDLKELFLFNVQHDIAVLKHAPNARLVKGGSWADGLIYIHPAAKQAVARDKSHSTIGFRVAMSNIN